MKEKNTEFARVQILSLIGSTYESDAAFEREFGLPKKTVNNWRRGLSASFMKMLPALAERFETTVAELLDVPVGRDAGELSEDETRLLNLYRKSRTLSQKMRENLLSTLEATISLYLSSVPQEAPEKAKRRPRVKKTEENQ